MNEYINYWSDMFVKYLNYNLTYEGPLNFLRICFYTHGNELFLLSRPNVASITVDNLEEALECFPKVSVSKLPKKIRHYVNTGLKTQDTEEYLRYFTQHMLLFMLCLKSKQICKSVKLFDNSPAPFDFITAYPINISPKGHCFSTCAETTVYNLTRFLICCCGLPETVGVPQKHEEFVLFVQGLDKCSYSSNGTELIPLEENILACVNFCMNTSFSTLTELLESFGFVMLDATPDVHRFYNTKFLGKVFSIKHTKWHGDMNVSITSEEELTLYYPDGISVVFSFLYDKHPIYHWYSTGCSTGTIYTDRVKDEVLKSKYLLTFAILTQNVYLWDTYFMTGMKFFSAPHKSQIIEAAHKYTMQHELDNLVEHFTALKRYNIVLDLHEASFEITLACYKTGNISQYELLRRYPLMTLSWHFVCWLTNRFSNDFTA